MKSFIIVWFVLFIAGAYGWIVNIVVLFHAGPVAQWGGMEVMRLVGVFAVPLGSVLGYF